MVATNFIKIFSITVLVAFLTSSVESATDCPPSIKSATTSNEKKQKYIVMFKKGDKSAADNHFQMLKDCYNARVEHVSEQSSFSATSEKILDFSVDGLQGYSGLLPPSMAEQIKKMQSIALVEADAKVKIQYAIPQNFTRRAVDNKPTKNDDRIDQAKRPLDGKYTFPDSAGKGVNIFVVDTGIRTTHSEFNGRAKFGKSFCDGCNDQDENGHGTHVSSIAAGKTLGVARNANLIAVRVLDKTGSGSNSAVINGLSFVLQQHNNGKNKNSVVNMSLGGASSQAVNSAVKDLTDAGVHVAVAAGNDGEDACKSSPASEPSAVTVGATEEDSEQITDFSNIGTCVDIFAPGRNIQGAGIKNDNDGAVFSGTSQATPHVAGTLALMIAKDGNKSPADLAKDLNDLSTKGVVEGIGNTKSPDSFLRIPSP
ncbi:peptidase S8/S53 domain-containing protein [Glomus cerebriforme]|uniref:Peptidase S8/S53 domain-containing protein n=1 Tax=Glomus cerebriforme TaxID=658196 RepID=A0A397TK93_9GLOM|nr:peptidase S8/S53 domain-containing protein [Glomus cerebriforme]